MEKYAHIGAKLAQFFREIPCFISQAVIRLRSYYINQILVQTAHIGINSHIVIVKNNQHISLASSSIIKRLKRFTTSKSAIAYYCYNLSVFAFCFCCYSHANSSRDRYRSMTSNKAIVLAFMWVWETRNTIQLAIGREFLSTFGKNFVAICLMPHIPHNTVVGRIERIM